MKLQPTSPVIARPSASKAPSSSSFKSAGPSHFDMYALVPSTSQNPSQTPISSTSPLSATKTQAVYGASAAQSDTPLVIAGVTVGTAHSASGVKIFGAMSPQTLKCIIGLSAGVGGTMLVGGALGIFFAVKRRVHRQEKPLASGTSSDNSSLSA